MVNPFYFLQQVRAEVSRITWPTRKETLTTSLMVFIMLLFFTFVVFLFDSFFSWLVQTILQFGL